VKGFLIKVQKRIVPFPIEAIKHFLTFLQVAV